MSSVVVVTSAVAVVGSLVGLCGKQKSGTSGKHSEGSLHEAVVYLAIEAAAVVVERVSSRPQASP